MTRVDRWDEAVARLQEWGQRALLTIGVRKLHVFTDAGIDLVARVLPEPGSLARCRELGLDEGQVIAAVPPHSVGFNRRCISRAAAGVMVSKDSGREGGLPEKAEAAAAEGIRLLVVNRPPEPGAYTDPARLMAALRRAG
jgi:precorrin-6x reductase